MGLVCVSISWRLKSKDFKDANLEMRVRLVRCMVCLANMTQLRHAQGGM
jgi:hypothetical protein